MGTRIHTIAMGVTNTYLLQGESGDCVLVDTGEPGKEAQFERGLAEAGVSPHRVKLVLVTHGHWDHIGCALSIKEKTGARVAMHQTETERLEQGRALMPRGQTLWGHVLGTVLGGLLLVMRVPRCQVDVTVTDEGLDLTPYGIRGRVIHTPGHSPGSLTVLLEGGDACVGDMAMNGLPLTTEPDLPIFAEDDGPLHESWKKLLDAGIRTVYPAHGKPFDATIMLQRLGPGGA